jgi:bacterial/archaeal transporter family protein
MRELFIDTSLASEGDAEIIAPRELDWDTIFLARQNSGRAQKRRVSRAARMLIAMSWTNSWTNSWVSWALLSAAFAAATALLAKVGVAHVDSNLAMALRTSVVVVFAWGIVLALGKHGEISSLGRRTVLFLALSGLATGLSWLCYFRALQLGPASRVAPLDKLSVPLVMVFAWLLLGEKLNPAAWIGGLLITAGAMVMVFG